MFKRGIIISGVFLMSACSQESTYQTSSGPEDSLLDQAESIVINSICKNNDLEEVIDYQGTKGVDRTFVLDRAVAVGVLQRPSGSKKYCSGTLVSENLFLTAKHCIKEGIETHTVIFNYAFNEDGELPKEELAYKIIGEVERGSMDYSVLELEGTPGIDLGYTDLRFEPADSDELLTIIQHPRGSTKKVDTGLFKRKSGNYMHYVVDTEGGSSGSGVLDIEGKLLGVHTNGGCGRFGGSNSGISLSKIPEDSLLRNL